MDKKVISSHLKSQQRGEQSLIVGEQLLYDPVSQRQLVHVLAVAARLASCHIPGSCHQALQLLHLGQVLLTCA